MKTLNLVFCASVLSLFISCSPAEDQAHSTAENQSKEQQDPLPSWNEGETKDNIIAYVSEVTREGSSDFIPVSDRIATFDNDGTLWSEKPLYFQLLFLEDRLKAMAPNHPEWNNQQPYKAMLEGDMESMKNQGMKGLMELLMTTHAGMTTEEFQLIVTDWLASTNHPSKNVPFTDLVYQPMLELIDYLKSSEFTVYIISAGGMEFMRPWADLAYGIPKDRIVGSTIKTEYDYNDGNPVLRRLPEMDFIDDHSGKPIAINKFIGRKPVLAAGNSDGDLEMLQWTDSNKYKSLQVYIHHTDSIREWAYDRNSIVGHFDKGLDEALAKSWTIVDMAKDWKAIYPMDN